MAILGKIREKSIVLILVIGMALFAFVISGVFDGAGAMSQEPVAIIGDEKVSPKANRVVIFDGSTLHNGHSPCEHNNRIIINSNYDVG